jgi:hypothetical protein
MTSGPDASPLMLSDTSLKPPSMLKADARLRRFIQKMPKRLVSGNISPGAIA